MAAEHCPRCGNWRSNSTLMDGFVRSPNAPRALAHEYLTRSECAACGIYWYEDKPEQQWFLGDGKPAT
jgi:hypothetical protein